LERERELVGLTKEREGIGGTGMKRDACDEREKDNHV